MLRIHRGQILIYAHNYIRIIIAREEIFHVTRNEWLSFNWKHAKIEKKNLPDFH